MKQAREGGAGISVDFLQLRPPPAGATPLVFTVRSWGLNSKASPIALPQVSGIYTT